MDRPRVAAPVGGLIAFAALLFSSAGCAPEASDAAPAPTAVRSTATGRQLLAAEPSCDPVPSVSWGRHSDHIRNNQAGPALACIECHPPVCTGDPKNVGFGPAASAGGTTPTYDPATHTCHNVACHGAALAAPTPTTWSWTAPLDAVTCGSCHGAPPPAPHPALTNCSLCHPDTVLADGTIDQASGRHLDGEVEIKSGSLGCAACHGYPPTTGAHLAHFGLAGTAAGGQYGDTRVLQDLPDPSRGGAPYGTGSPTAAPDVYAFGCGNCHPLDPAKHIDGNVDVELRNASAPASSLKAMASAVAAYDATTKTCNSVYCHSTGQATPNFKQTPSWATETFTPETRCTQCHDDPPAYTAANSHAGHVLGMPGQSHYYTWSAEWLRGSMHGSPPAYQTLPASYASAGFLPPYDTTPMTCQTCHFDTVDPKNTSLAADGTPIGYYYLHTGGNQAALCAGCHTPGGNPGTGNGKTLPLRHVNGTRDVRFDPRTGEHDGPAGQSLTDVPWIPNVPGTAYVGVRKPPKPYWITNAYRANWGCRPGGQELYPGYGGTAYCPPNAVWMPNYYYRDMFTDPATAVYCRNYPRDCSAGWVESWYATISFSLDNASYDAQRKTCSNVGCHLGSWSYPEYNSPTWGVPARNCFPCHRNPP